MYFSLSCTTASCTQREMCKTGTFKTFHFGEKKGADISLVTSNTN